MATAKLSDMMSRLGRRLPNGEAAESASDADLLARFLATRDEHAFALIVRRHGPMVLGVCRRVTGHHHLAEDAFQAVFVVLAAKAGSVQPRAALPAWLYGVAYRTALRARTMSDRRRRRESQIETMPDPGHEPLNPVEAADTIAVLDEEIARLPEHLRAAVVLCELQGASRHDAAKHLGIAEGTLSSRLATARKALAKRLHQRGLALSAAGLTAALGQAASASVPAVLTEKAVAAALAPQLIPAPVAVLSNGVLRMMLAQKLKAIPVAVVLVAAVVFAGGLLGSDVPGAPAPTKTALALVEAPKADPPAEKKREGSNRLLVWKKERLVLMDAEGKNEEMAAEPDGKLFVKSGKISPDGTRFAILYQVGLDAVSRTAAQAIPPHRGLYVRSIHETGPGTDLEIECQMFCWSPDGTEIAYSEFVDQKGKLTAIHGIVNVKTKEKKALTIPNDHIITDWSRDGKFFLTCDPNMDRENPRARMYLLNRDGTVHKALGDPKQLAVLGRLSPDSTRVLFLQVVLPKEETPAEIKARENRGRPMPQAMRKLAVLELAGGKATPVADTPLDGELQSFCWSPDGKRIVYTWRQVHAGKPEDVLNKETESFLVLSDPDGKNQKTIASEKGLGQYHITLSHVDWGIVIDDQKKEKTDAEKILGMWKVVSAMDGGENQDTKEVLTFGKDKITVEDRESKSEWKAYKLEPGKNPKWIDLTTDGKTYLGIYELDGDKLKICINEDSDSDRKRPTEFLSKKQTNFTLMVLEREKK